MKPRRVKVSETPLEKGPGGRFLCRWCKVEVKPPRKTFCSALCVHEWKLRSNTGYIRKLVYERDGGNCALCGLDTTQVDRELRSLRFKIRLELTGNCMPSKEPLSDPRFQTRCDELGLPKGLRRLSRSLWEADHVVPVCEGGGGCGIENYRTLCWKCHLTVTKELAARRKTNSRPK